jgi:hypothetical protein
MTGQETWLTFAFIAGGGLLVVVLGWLATRASKPGRGEHYESHCVACSRKGQIFDCTFVADNATGKLEPVVRCSAFADPERVRCEQHCVDELNEMKA